MRVAVFGTGGVGAYFGARLAASGIDVTFIARGAHLDAIQRKGLKVDSVAGDMHIAPARATASAADVGAVDAVLLGVKTWQVREAAQALAPLLGPETFVVPLQNGVETAAEIAATVGATRVVGGLSSGFCFIVAPGHVRHIGGATFIKFGELDRQRTPRVERLLDAFLRAGVDASVPEDINVALWEKLLLVVPFGSVGAVARAPIGVLMSVTETRTLIERGVREAAAVARALGVALPSDCVERTLDMLDGLTPTGTTSLQRDIADGKRSELDAWTGAVVRLAARAGVAAPVHGFIYSALQPLERRARGELAF